MLRFRTSYDKVVHLTPAGTGEHLLYSAAFDDNKTVVLKAQGSEDRYAIIQSYAADCDINAILDRARGGDSQVLQRRQATYGDFSGAPNGFADAYNRLYRAEAYFNTLSPDQRDKYGNNFVRFIEEVDRVGLPDVGSNGAAAPVAPEPESSGYVDRPVDKVEKVEVIDSGSEKK